jgi:hypothetical protein
MILGRLGRGSFHGRGALGLAEWLIGLAGRLGRAIRPGVSVGIGGLDGGTFVAGVGGVLVASIALDRFAVERLALDDVAGALGRSLVWTVVPASSARSSATSASGPTVRFGLGVAMGALLFVDEGLPVGNRDLIVIGMDFAERQEAVAVSAVVDEGGLQRGFDARYLGEIDVPTKLFAVSRLEVEFLDPIST